MITNHIDNEPEFVATHISRVRDTNGNLITANVSGTGKGSNSKQSNSTAVLLPTDKQKTGSNPRSPSSAGSTTIPSLKPIISKF